MANNKKGCNILNPRKRYIQYIVFGTVILSLLCTLGFWQWSRQGVFVPNGHRRLTQSFGKSLANYEYDTHTYFAGTTVQLFLQMLGDMHDNPKSFYHNPENIDIVLRSLKYSNPKLMHHRRHADRPYEVHAIGTASCGIKVGLQPASISALIAHGLYTKAWNEDWNEHQTPCEIRQKVIGGLGAAAELHLWLFSTLTGYGLEPPLIHGMALEMQKNFTKFSSSVDKEVIFMMLCDEIEEHVGSAQWFTRNWKHRPVQFYDDLLYMARAYDSPMMEEMLLLGFNNTQIYYPLEHPQPSSAVDDSRKRLVDMVKLMDKRMEKTAFPVMDSAYIRTDFVKQAYKAQVAMKHKFATVWTEMKTFMTNMDCMRPGAEKERFPPGWEELKKILVPA